MSDADSAILLWDIDGTLIEHAPMKRDRHAHAVHLALGTPTAPIPPGIGKTDRQIVIEIMTQHTEPTSDLIQAALDHLDVITDEDLASEPAVPLPGVAQVLTHLTQTDHRLLTGNTPRRAAAKTGSAGIVQHFDLAQSFYGGDHPTRFDLVASARTRLGDERASRTVIIGDTPLDIAAARAADLKVIAVATGAVSLDELAEYEPDAMLDDLSGDPAEVARLIASVIEVV